MKSRLEHKFESNVLRVACLIGLLRSIIEVSGDILKNEPLPNFALDVGFIVVFSLALIVLRMRLQMWKILLLFYAPFILLICMMLVDAEGLAYSVESNVFAAFVIISFTARGHWILLLNALLFLTVIFSLGLVEYMYQSSQFFEPKVSNPINFVFSSIGIIAFTWYAKAIFNDRKKRLSDSIDSWNHRNHLLTEKSQELLQKKKTLEDLIEGLDNRVKSHADQLKSQKAQVEKYLSITMTELFEAYQKTVRNMESFDQMDDPNNLVPLIERSGDRLKVEMEALLNKIEESIHEVD